MRTQPVFQQWGDYVEVQQNEQHVTLTAADAIQIIGLLRGEDTEAKLVGEFRALTVAEKKALLGLWAALKGLANI